MNFLSSSSPFIAPLFYQSANDKESIEIIDLDRNSHIMGNIFTDAINSTKHNIDLTQIHNHLTNKAIENSFLNDHNVRIRNELKLNENLAEHKNELSVRFVQSKAVYSIGILKDSKRSKRFLDETNLHKRPKENGSN